MSFTELLPKILLALVTTAFSDVYKRICRWLTERGKRKSIAATSDLILVALLENYREQRVHDDHMITKLFVVCACNGSVDRLDLSRLVLVREFLSECVLHRLLYP